MFVSAFDPRKCGERLRQARIAKGLTQEDVGKFLGQKGAKTAISSHETGKRTPRPDELVRLAQYYGASLDYLLTGKEGSEFLKKTQQAGEVLADRESEKALQTISKLKAAGFSAGEIDQFIEMAVAMAIAIKKPSL